MMEQGATRNGRKPDGTPNETHRVSPHLLGLHVRVTVECRYHGHHTATVMGPFLWCIDLIAMFRELSAQSDRWVITEYTALDYVPEKAVSEWV